LPSEEVGRHFIAAGPRALKRYQDQDVLDAIDGGSRVFSVDVAVS
jgi:hypothetical protein